MTWSRPPRLKAGEVVRLEPEGPTFRVVRVNESGATIRPHHERPVPVLIPGKAPFFAASGGSTITISAHAFVYRLKGEV